METALRISQRLEFNSNKTRSSFSNHQKIVGKGGGAKLGVWSSGS